MLYVYSGKQVRNATTIECVLVTAGNIRWRVFRQIDVVASTSLAVRRSSQEE